MLKSTLLLLLKSIYSNNETVTIGLAAKTLKRSLVHHWKRSFKSYELLVQLCILLFNNNNNNNKFR